VDHVSVGMTVAKAQVDSVVRPNLVVREASGGRESAVAAARGAEGCQEQWSACARRGRWPAVAGQLSKTDTRG